MTEEIRKPIALETRESAGLRLSSPSAGRNRVAIAEALAELLPHHARVLEIASGTGEHALACLTRRSDIHWTPSDPDAASRASCDDWACDASGRMGICLPLDVMQPDWMEGLPPVDAVFCANMIHIAPWEAARGLFAGAERLLPAGQLHLYGPFQDGDRTAPSNLAFDESLKSRDPRWGVRHLQEVDALAATHGFSRMASREMPANNLMLSYGRGGAA